MTTRGGGWVTPEEAASLRSAAQEFHRLDRLAAGTDAYDRARLAAAQVLAGRVEELLETLRQQATEVLAGGTSEPPRSNAEARARRGVVTLFGMEVAAGERVEDLARSLGYRHSDACTNCVDGGHPDFCTWLPVEEERLPNRLEAGGMGRCRIGFERGERT